MADFFREQPRLRLLIGGAIMAIVWAMYVVRVTLGIGPMHDTAGQQAPAVHYLVGALVATAMVGVWIVVRAFTARRH
jgi:hypothetical protein